jgi:hypothetical protein
VSALVTLDPDAMAGWAAESGMAGTSYAEIVSSPAAREMVQGYIDELNAKLNRWETIKSSSSCARDLSVEEGDLTPSMKLKRRVVADSTRASWTRSTLEPMPESPGDSPNEGPAARRDLLFRRLEPLLEQVSKPIQYVGGELNSTVKDWNCGGSARRRGADARWALMYPDAYEVGLPNQGVMILYEVSTNARTPSPSGRTAVWPDMEALLRSEGCLAVHR